MQEHSLSCDEVRARMARYLAGEPDAALTAHLATCGACLEAFMDAALRRAPDVEIPTHFRSRVIAKLSEAPSQERPEVPWPLAAAAATLAALGVGLWWNGELPGALAAAAEALLRPTVLLAAGVLETVLSLTWVWRMITVDRDHTT